jgi:hypothetical protein
MPPDSTEARLYNQRMLDRIKAFANRRPRTASWIFLAIGMVLILVLSAPKDGTLTPMNWVFLILATIGLAGLCSWIIGWEAGEAEEGAESS